MNMQVFLDRIYRSRICQCC